MIDRKLKTLALAALLLLVTILLAACRDDDTDAGAGLSREEVQEIVRSEAATSATAPGPTGLTRAEVEAAIQSAMAQMPEPAISNAQIEAALQQIMAAIPEPGLTRAEVEAAIQAAIGDLPQSEPGLTADEARTLAQYAVATVPPKTSPAEYTRLTPSAGTKRRDGKPLWPTITGSRVLTTSGMSSSWTKTASSSPTSTPTSWAKISTAPLEPMRRDTPSGLKCWQPARTARGCLSFTTTPSQKTLGRITSAPSSSNTPGW